MVATNREQKALITEVGKLYQSSGLIAATPLQRPNTSPTYTSGKAIGTGGNVVFQFPTDILGAPQQTNWLIESLLVVEKLDIAVTDMGVITGHLYNKTPLTPPSGDNQVWRSLMANQSRYLGWIDYTTWRGGGSGSDIVRSYGQAMCSPMELKAAIDEANLYMILVAGSDFTGVAQAWFHPYISMSQV